MCHKTVFLLTLLLLVTTASEAQIEKYYNNQSFPTDYAEIQQGIFICETELSIGEYKKYLHNIKEDSLPIYYEAQLPDSATLVYIEEANTNTCGCGPMYISRYEHPAYFNLPAFGLSYQQVLNYCDWLTTNTDTFKLNNKSYKLKYRLPTVEEWDLANKSNQWILVKPEDAGYLNKEYCDRNRKIYDSLNIPKRLIDQVICSNYNVSDNGIFILKDSIYTYNKSEPDCYLAPQPKYVNDIISNEIGLIHMNDNMSEMTIDKGIAKGFNFHSQTIGFNRNARISYYKPEPWLGARLVCELIEIKTKSE